MLAEGQHAATNCLEVRRLGIRPYREVWEFQKAYQKDLISGRGGPILVTCQHPEVITLGTSASAKNVLVDQLSLASQGIEVISVERGGDVTWHGPGQLVAYPLLDLHTKKKDVGWYMRSLEEVVLETMAHFGVSGTRIQGRAGVWMSERRKICSMGVRLSRWCSMHGLALNVSPCHEAFSRINPCGYQDIEMTSLEEEAGRAISVSEVEEVLIEKFCKTFEY